MAKVALGNKTTYFGISYKLLAKNSNYKKIILALLTSATFSREIKKPLRKIKSMICEKNKDCMAAWLDPT